MIRSLDSKASETAFKAIWSAFVVLGSLMSLGSLIDLGDSALFLLSVFNIIGLYLLAPIVKRELDKFLDYVRERKARAAVGGEEPEEEAVKAL